ncbi:hypothetical protein BJY16_004631 [Actinoplanes octamycinicus]|uniref:Effector-associated domain-containing protein n=1 Tax=Actinoplanes octamycinicus TaxID=135948 RepID=A0A7W7GZU6_9ACTN|nr:caspase family protein [Actinoplanes octamycinicus]MBB4741172.1 hypothetical protein [Actinoplanes octamycinicus]GIE56079.1 hypothetical protein Aoc01nite_14810 [Actinoplanes octamycinicus]
MTEPARNPRDARVILVGIDDYRGGPGWSLRGPVDDALRFAEFFVAQGVPPERVTVLTAPAAAPDRLPSGVDSRPADRATIREVLVRETGPQTPDGDLYVLWGGHGFVDLDRRRRLLYPDATEADPLDLDLDSLLRRYRSDRVSGLDRQTWLIDVCQVHEPEGLDATGHETFAAGTDVPYRVQEVYLAAALGQPAVNLGRQRTGLFSREVLRLLATGGLDLLADPRRLATAIEDRFTELRAGGAIDQTPTYLWYRDALGREEGQLLRRRPPSLAGTRPEPPATRLKPVVDALVDLPEFRRPADREHILSLLSASVYGSIRRNDQTRFDAVGIIRGCSRHSGGLAELVEAVRFFVPEGTAVDRFASAVSHLQA